jgi:hypothetical protein
MGESLHFHPDPYWCPDCWKFDCLHLVEALHAPTVPLDHSIIKLVSYHRQSRILQLTLNTAERYQYFGVPRDVTVQYVKQPDMRLRFRFKGVRGRDDVRLFVIGMANLLQELVQES